MADAKLTALADDATPTTDDLLYAVNDPAGTPGSKKVTIANLDTLLSATAKTLTNKTLTAPKFADLGFIADANGNELIVMDTVASAVPYVRVANAATGGTAKLIGDGETNTSLDLQGSGTGGVLLHLRTQAIDASTNATTTGIRFQIGTCFINNDGTEASSRTITFPTAFTTVLGALAGLSGIKAAADPSDITDTTAVGLSDTVAYMVGVGVITTTSMSLTIKRSAAASGTRAVASWIAWGT